MTEHITQLRREARTPDHRGGYSALPPDLQEQVRGRMRLLAALMLVAFSFDIVLYLVEALVAWFQGSAGVSGRSR